MVPIEWKESTDADARVTASKSSSKVGKSDGPVTDGKNPWFGVAMALIGVIVGYIIGSF